MDMAQKTTRTFQDVIQELSNLHSREISDLTLRIHNWKERFESLVNQKHSYKDEILKLRQENCTYKKEIRKLEDQIKTNQQRSNVTCVSCDSLRKSMETVELVYERSLDEKDKIIEFLEKRLMEYTHGKSIIGNAVEGYTTPNKIDDLSINKNKRSSSSGKKQSPDSTCSNEILEEDGDIGSSKTQSQSNKTSGKLRLSKQNKKRKNRYSEDPSPEQKRVKISSSKQKTSDGGENVSLEIPPPESRGCLRKKTSAKSSIFVPETLDICNDNFADEAPIPEDNFPNKTDLEEKGSNLTVPETVAMEMCDTNSDSNTESELNVTVKEKKVYNLQAMLESPPSGADNSDQDDDGNGEMGKRSYVNHRTLNLSGLSTRNDSDSSEDDEEKLTVREMKASERSFCETEQINTSKNDIQIISESEKKNGLSSSNSTKISANQKEQKQKGPASKYGKRLVSDSRKGPVSKSQKNSDISSPLSLDIGNAINNERSDDIDVLKSPSVLRHVPAMSDSEPESPLLLRVGVSSSQEIEKSHSNSFGKLTRGQTFPTTGKRSSVVDLDSSDLRKDGNSRNVDISNIEKCDDNHVQRVRRTRNSQSRVSRSLENVSDGKGGQVDVSRSKSMSSAHSSLGKDGESTSVRNSKESRNDKYLGDGSVCESRVLRQTTLSQVFRNSPPRSKYRPSAKEKSREEEDLQKAIELSLRENQAFEDIEVGLTDSSVSNGKENAAPFKKPCTPKKVKKLSQSSKSPSPRRNPNRKCKPDLDETVSPSALYSPGTSVGRSARKMPEISPDRFNGSLDPAIQLSQLCVDTEPQGEQYIKSKKENENISPDIPIDHSPEESAIFVSPDSNIAALHDFTLRDLQNNKHGGVLTSTCIEDDSQGIPSSLRSVKFGHGIKRNLRLVENYSEDIVDLEDEDVVADKDTVDCSFDRVPSKNEPGFAHVEVVRKQDERRKLKGFKCKECLEYYEGMDLNEEEKEKRMQACSRHRAKYVAPDTPEHFWSIHFLNTPDLEDKGYAHKEEKTKPSLHRRRIGLKKIFKSKTEEEQENPPSSQKDDDVSDLDF